MQAPWQKNYPRTKNNHKMTKRGIGLALGGGSVKGFAHIGVLKVLEKHDISVSHIAGTSIGSAIGAIYAAGYKAKEMEDLVLNANWEKMIDLSFPPKEGMLEGKEIEMFVNEILKNKTFKQLEIPFATISTNLISGETLIFNKGNVTKAVRASISYPGFFVPVHYQNMLLVDGGVLKPVPVDTVKALGAKKVLAINLNQKESKSVFYKKKMLQSDFRKEFKDTIFNQEIKEINKYIQEKKIKLPFYINIMLKSGKVRNLLKRKQIKVPEIIKILFRSVQVMGDKLTEQSLINADVIITPELKRVGYLEFDKIKYIIKAGEKAAQKNIRKIKKLTK